MHPQPPGRAGWQPQLRQDGAVQCPDRQPPEGRQLRRRHRRAQGRRRCSTPSGLRVRILDLPGAYSLDPLTPDEQVTADVLLGRRAGETAPDFVVCVTDATNLRQNLRLALSLKRLGLPMVVALNMTDIARRKGMRHRCRAPRGRTRRAGGRDRRRSRRPARGPWSRCSIAIGCRAAARRRPVDGSTPTRRATSSTIRPRCGASSARSAAIGIDGVTFSDRVDAVVLHPVLGPLILALVLFLVFQAVFAWAQVPMDAIKSGVGAFGELVGAGAAAEPAQGPAGQRRAGGRRQRAGVPAADHHPVLLHLGARGFGLSAARRIPARPGDGQRRTVRARLHPAAVELRLRHSRHHGDAHHPKSARPTGHHHDRAAHDLLGAAAGLRADHRRIHSAAQRLGRPSSCRAWCCSRSMSPASPAPWRWPTC